MTVDTKEIQELLSAVAAGDTSVASALERLQTPAYEDVPGARIDHDRTRRRGFPEVVLGLGKTAEQIATIVERVVARSGHVLVTRLEPERAPDVIVKLSDLDPRYDPVARILIGGARQGEIRGRGPVLVVSAGTSDIPVAEEAAVCAEEMGNTVDRLYDVGVAGIHRLLGDTDRLRAAEVLIVVAGMEGALPSVVGGLVERPVIAVPTSIGYGAALGGLTALLGMLTSCAAGVTVVNIDNGFGAAYAASLMNRQ